MMKMRIGLVTTLGFMLTTVVIANAWIQKQQFYPTVVYLTKSSPCLAVLYFQALILVILFGKLMIKLFFGTLSSSETENLFERSWYAITDTCLAFTMFRDDLNPLFVASFTLLLFLKCFHWLLEQRVDVMEQSPVITILFKIRVFSLLLLLMACDICLVFFSYLSTMSKGPSVQLVFGFEYSVLAVVLISIFFKYALHLIDLQSVNPWENKAFYMLYVELITGFLRVIFYLLFTAIMIKVHTFPLFCIRPMYITLRQFKKAVSDIVLSRRAIQRMNTLYPDATAEDLRESDATCIICREEMQAERDGPTPPTVNKKLPCGHIFHASCLRSWFQRQQTCPTCRSDILSDTAATEGRNRANNAPPQQNQQQPPAPAAGPPPLPNQFPGLFPPPPGYPLPQNMVVPPVPPPLVAPAPAGEGAGTSQAGTSSDQQAPFLPPMLPPYPMMLPPPPPPPLPLNFTGMSDEQVRQMEGEERNAVEKRIECLRNVQLLLDAAMAGIQQYMSVQQNTTMFQNINFAATTVPSTTQAESSSVVTTTASTTNATPSTSEIPSTNATPSTSEIPSTSATPSTNEIPSTSATLSTVDQTLSPVEEASPINQSDSAGVSEDTINTVNTNVETSQASSSQPQASNNINSTDAAEENIPPNLTELRRRRMAALENKINPTAEEEHGD